jgi:hypothetical protein
LEGFNPARFYGTLLWRALLTEKRSQKPFPSALKRFWRLNCAFVLTWRIDLTEDGRAIFEAIHFGYVLNGDSLSGKTAHAADGDVTGANGSTQAARIYGH